jgi:hypothetical protein
MAAPGEASITMRIRAAVDVEYPEHIDRPRWEFNDLLREGRELIIPVGDLLLMFSEPAARWLLAMLAAIVPLLAEAIGQHEPAAAACGTLVGDDIRVRIHVAVGIHHPGEIGRPRWDRRELVITIGGVVVVFSESAARRLLDVLTAILDPPREGPEG